MIQHFKEDHSLRLKYQDNDDEEELQNEKPLEKNLLSKIERRTEEKDVLWLDELKYQKKRQKQIGCWEISEEDARSLL